MSNYWTGKGKGEKIVLKFNKALLGDVTGLSTPVFYDAIIPPGTPTASGQYSATYTPDKAFDGSTSTRWYIRTTGDQWIQIELPEPRFTNGFRWYAGSSYRPNGFTVQGSNDGESWTNIYSDNSANTTGWKEFFWDPAGPFKFYRWTVTSRHSTYLYIYEIELSLGAGNEAAFTVTGMERSPTKYGEPILREYKVKSIERYPDEGLEDTHLLITMTQAGRFCDTEGDLTITYERAKGSLTGNRPVEDFTETFTPTDLEPTPASDQGLITGGINVEVSLNKLTRTDLYHKHTITGGISVTVELIPVSEIPP